jgi:hypothetical protein
MRNHCDFEFNAEDDRTLSGYGLLTLQARCCWFNLGDGRIHRRLNTSPAQRQRAAGKLEMEIAIAVR